MMRGIEDVEGTDHLGTTQGRGLIFNAVAVLASPLISRSFDFLTNRAESLARTISICTSHKLATQKSTSAWQAGRTTK